MAPYSVNKQRGLTFDLCGFLFRYNLVAARATPTGTPQLSCTLTPHPLTPHTLTPHTPTTPVVLLDDDLVVVVGRRRKRRRRRMRKKGLERHTYKVIV